MVRAVINALCVGTVPERAYIMRKLTNLLGTETESRLVLTVQHPQGGASWFYERTTNRFQPWALYRAGICYGFASTLAELGALRVSYEEEDTV